MTCRPQAPPGNLEWQQNSSKPTCLLRYFGYWQEKNGQTTQKRCKSGGKRRGKTQQNWCTWTSTLGKKLRCLNTKLLEIYLYLFCSTPHPYELLACYLNAQMGLKPVFFFILLLMVSDLSSAPGSSSRLRCCRDPNLRIRADPRLQTEATTPMQAPQIFLFVGE